VSEEYGCFAAHLMRVNVVRVLQAALRDEVMMIVKRRVRLF